MPDHIDRLSLRNACAHIQDARCNVSQLQTPAITDSDLAQDLRAGLLRVEDLALALYEQHYGKRADRRSVR